jgi:hypothetical protein
MCEGKVMDLLRVVFNGKRTIIMRFIFVWGVMGKVAIVLAFSLFHLTANLEFPDKTIFW